MNAKGGVVSIRIEMVFKVSTYILILLFSLPLITPVAKLTLCDVTTDISQSGLITMLRTSLDDVNRG